MSKNITLAVDEDILADVRRYAAAHDTTVNALVREALETIAERVRRQEVEWEELFNLADETGAARGDRTWSRQGLHER
jgi:predicted transcriptional regulator